ncbi:MAG: peptidase [Pseudonocardiales bacterium]|nr:peptidase [Pseudonocardiales bacterium]
MTARMLLLSWGDSAVAGFIAGGLAVGRDPGPARIAFVATAAEPYAEASWSVEERARLIKGGYELTDVDLGATQGEDLRVVLSGMDVLYVGGGNTFYLLDKVRRSGLDALLPRQFDRGMLYIGLSAGASLMGPDVEPMAIMDDPSVAPDLVSTEGLGYLAEVPIPHVASGLYEPEVFDGAIREFGGRFSLRLLRDDEALLVEDGDVTLIASF